jgi:hypothetical protein
MRAGSRAPTLEWSRANRKGETVDETYRMLGSEHQADLEREAQRRHLAAAARASRPASTKAAPEPRRRTRMRWVPARLAALLR